MSNAIQLPQARYVGPSFEDAKVHDAMRVGVVTCRPQTKLEDVARIMVNYQIHSVVVDDPGAGGHPWSIVTGFDLARATASGREGLNAGDIAKAEGLLTIPADEPLERAAELMSAHQVGHLIAVQPETGRPVGVISALGLANVVAASGA
jgi:crotonyl-CoA carboxylase/reductase